MKTVCVAALVLLITLPARAGIDPLPTPLGLTLGAALDRSLSTLKTLKANVTTDDKKQPGIHGKPYIYTRVQASLPTGPIERLKLYFYDNKLARMQLLSRDRQPPLAIESLGKASLQSPTGRQFWWNRSHMSGVSCQGIATKMFSSPKKSDSKGECEIFDMRVLVDILGNRQQIAVQFQLLVQGTAEKIQNLRNANP